MKSSKLLSLIFVLFFAANNFIVAQNLLKMPELKPLPKTGVIDQPVVNDLKVDSNKISVNFDVLRHGNIYYNGYNLSDICDIELGGTSVKNKSIIKEINRDNREPMAFALVLDHSGSMKDNIEKLQQAVINLIKNKKKDDYIVIIKFDDKVRTITEGVNTDDLIKEFPANGLEGFGGKTALDDALLMGVEKLKSLPRNKYQKKFVIAFTDGKENSSYMVDSTSFNHKVLETSIENKIQISTADFGNDVDSDFMQNIAQVTNGYYYHLHNSVEMDPLFQDILMKINNKFIIDIPFSSFGKLKLTIKFCIDTAKKIERYVKIPINKGNVVTLDIKFDFNKDVVKAESYPLIEQFSHLLKDNPLLTQIELGGHSDTVGNADYNLDLSLHRAKAVKKILVDKYNIDDKRLIAQGYGESKLVSLTNMDADRRVEGKVITIEPDKTDTTINEDISKLKKYLSKDGDSWKKDTIVMTTLGRNRQWKNMLIITDWSEKNYRYGAQAMLWHKENIKKSGLKYFCLFNDGECKPKIVNGFSSFMNLKFRKVDANKPMGRADGIYFQKASTSIDSLLDLFRYVDTQNECNKDVPENDLEATAKAMRNYQNYTDVVLVADNNAGVRDFSLLKNLKRPVHVIVFGNKVGNKYYINEQLLDIAHTTKGSLHIADKDIDLKNDSAMTNDQIRLKYHLKIVEPSFKEPLHVKNKVKIAGTKYPNITSIYAVDEFYNFKYDLKKKKENYYILPTNAKRNTILYITSNGVTSKIYLEDFKYKKFSRKYLIN